MPYKVWKQFLDEKICFIEESQGKQALSTLKLLVQFLIMQNFEYVHMNSKQGIHSFIWDRGSCHQLSLQLSCSMSEFSKVVTEAYTHYFDGNYELAVSKFSEAIALDPIDPNSRIYKGVSLEN